MKCDHLPPFDRQTQTDHVTWIFPKWNARQTVCALTVFGRLVLFMIIIVWNMIKCYNADFSPIGIETDDTSYICWGVWWLDGIVAADWWLAPNGRWNALVRRRKIIQLSNAYNQIERERRVLRVWRNFKINTRSFTKNLSHMSSLYRLVISIWPMIVNVIFFIGNKTNKTSKQINISTRCVCVCVLLSIMNVKMSLFK